MKGVAVAGGGRAGDALGSGQGGLKEGHATSGRSARRSLCADALCVFAAALRTATAAAVAAVQPLLLLMMMMLMILLLMLL